MFEISVPIPHKTQSVFILMPSILTHMKSIIIQVKYTVTNVLGCGTYVFWLALQSITCFQIIFKDLLPTSKETQCICNDVTKLVILLLEISLIFSRNIKNTKILALN